MKLHNPFDDLLHTSVGIIASMYVLIVTAVFMVIYTAVYWSMLTLWVIPISAAARVAYYVFRGK